MRNGLLAGVLVLFCSVEGLNATVSLDLFCNHCAWGGGSYAGGTNPVTYNLFIDLLPLNSSTAYGGYSIFGGHLNLLTGNPIGGDPSAWNFGSGGAFTLTGSIVTLDSSGIHQVLSHRTLFTGSVFSVTMIVFTSSARTWMLSM